MIRKASAASHGTDAGWHSGYADGQAMFGPLRFSRSYYVFDGAYRNDADWSIHSAYGFAVDSPAGTDPQDVYGDASIRYSLLFVALIGGLASVFFWLASASLREDLAARDA